MFKAIIKHDFVTLTRYCIRQGNRPTYKSLKSELQSETQERVMYPSFELLSRHYWEAEVHFFITTDFQTIFRGAQDHPTGNMTPHFVPWPMNYSFLISKLLITDKLLGSSCNKAPNTFDFTTCRTAVRLRRWLLNWYLAIKRQRKKCCGFYYSHSQVSIHVAAIGESIRTPARSAKLNSIVRRQRSNIYVEIITTSQWMNSSWQGRER